MEMVAQVDSEYLLLIQWSLEMWLVETENLSDDTLDEINAETENIYQAISEGLKQEETVELSAQLLIQTKLLAERRGHWQAWIPLLEETSCNNINPLLSVKLLNQLGYLYVRARNIYKAIDKHKLAHSMANELNEVDELVRAKANLCNDYRHVNLYDKSSVIGFEAISLIKSDPHLVCFVTQAIAYNGYGLLQLERGMYSDALKILLTAEKIYKHLSDLTYLGQISVDLSLAMCNICLLYTSPSPRDLSTSRMPSSA